MLLEELQKDGKQSIKQLAEKVQLSITPVHERIKKLESSNVIEKYVAVVNASAFGKNLVAYCQVKLVRHQKELFEEFERYIVGFEEVEIAVHTAGAYDFLLKARFSDVQDYQNFIVNKISQLSIIHNIQCSFAVEYVKQNHSLNCFIS